MFAGVGSRRARDGIGRARYWRAGQQGSRRARDGIGSRGTSALPFTGSRRARDGIVHRLPQDLPGVGSRHTRNGVGHAARPQGFRGGNRRTLWNLGTTEGLARTLAVGAAPSIGSRQRGRCRRPSRTPTMPPLTVKARPTPGGSTAPCRRFASPALPGGPRPGRRNRV